MDLEDKIVEIIKQNRKENNFKNGDHLRNVWDNIRYIDMPIIGVLERDERERKGQITYWRK